MGKVKYIFIIDTDTYSGNFEREMCAYCTGVIGECGFGIEAQKVYFKEVIGKDIEPDDYESLYSNPFYDLLDQVSDDSGCHRPVVIWNTPGYLNDGRGNHFKVEDKSKVEMDTYPAYQSIAIFFLAKPSESDIVLIKNRSKEFCDYNVEAQKAMNQQCEVEDGKVDKINILGFRLIKQEIVESEENI